MAKDQWLDISLPFGKKTIMTRLEKNMADLKYIVDSKHLLKG
jgi:hypothetical protein